jgi:hypothetical protein
MKSGSDKSKNRDQTGGARHVAATTGSASSLTISKKEKEELAYALNQVHHAGCNIEETVIGIHNMKLDSISDRGKISELLNEAEAEAAGLNEKIMEARKVLTPNKAT